MPCIRSTNSGGVIRGYLKLDFAHFWLGGGDGHRNPSIRNLPIHLSVLCLFMCSQSCIKGSSRNSCLCV